MGMDRWTVVMGAGRSGMAAAHFLAAQGRMVVLSDRGAAPPGPELERLALAGVAGVWGDHPEGLLEACDELILSPGIPRSTPFVAVAIARGIPVIGEVELAHRALRAKKDGSKVLAITGTNGKSTTTDLLAHLLRVASIPSVACGNLGTPFLEAVQTAGPNTVFALELSSYQLESMDQFHAEGAAFLNLTPDHLARYGSMDAYRAAKLRIFERQIERDLRVVPASDQSLPGSKDGVPVATFGWSEPSGLGAFCDDDGNLWVKDQSTSIKKIIHRSELKILGDHNVENALAASLLAWHGGANLEAITQGLRGYAGLAHRIAFCGEKNGISAFNDSKGTNVDATLIALRALPGPLVLLLGGSDKGASYEPLREALQGKLRRLVFLGEAIPHLKRDLGDLPHDAIQNFDEAVMHAFSMAETGDQILLSPACASFDQFKNFEERGRRFESLVKTWQSR
jgi:UDP-N-acetylmuramoylalanine--D-glutamate ligase